VNLTHDDVQEILRLLDTSSFDELHLETDRFKLTLRRSGVGGWTQETRTLSTPRVTRPDVAAAAEAARTPSDSGDRPATVAGSTQASAEGIAEVRSPIIGTFYRAPKPGAPPFVEVGSEVTPETVIGIIETMKLMNSVYAGAHGNVFEICMGDGKFVEQDQVLMRLQQGRV
jgi:acetyl-CoA carboxylase biotin carboxyl carrier protein